MLGQGDNSRRVALVIATSRYQEESLAHLRAPGTDARELAEVLADTRVGGFDVQTLLDAPHDQLMRGVLELCSSAGPTDFVLVYLSCHGLVDDRGRLFYASTNTERRLLAATAISAAWLNEQLEDCRARSQVLMLDCCHSGAFAKGAKGDSALALQDRFPGRGKVVLTASRATEYSFEGEEVVGKGVTSVFTRAIVEGLRTGDADINSDGAITVTDLYQFLFAKVREMEPRQTPGMWTYGSEGDLVIAHSVRTREIRPAPLPPDIVGVLENPRPRIRGSGVVELADILDKGPPELALAAEIQMRRMAEEDVPSVAGLARVALEAVHGTARDSVELRIDARDASVDSPSPGTKAASGQSSEALRAHLRSSRKNEGFYRTAKEAEAHENWPAAVQAYMLVQDDPVFPDAAERRAFCEKQQQIGDLQGKLRRLAGTESWEAVVTTAEELSKLDKAASNPDGLTGRARLEILARSAEKSNTPDPSPQLPNRKAGSAYSKAETSRQIAEVLKEDQLRRHSPRQKPKMRKENPAPKSEPPAPAKPEKEALGRKWVGAIVLILLLGAGIIWAVSLSARLTPAALSSYSPTYAPYSTPVTTACPCSVVYEVEGTATGTDVTLQTDTGRVQQTNSTIPLTDKSTGSRGFRFTGSSGSRVYISALNTGPGGTITCRITVNGNVVSTDSGDSVATCAGFLP